MTNRSARLELVDMPRDKTRALGSLPQAICGSFNYCRQYPRKMVVLKAVLKYAYNRIVQFEKEQKAREDEQLRNQIVAKAESLGIDLDERLGTDKLQEALDEAILQAESEAKSEPKQS